MNFTDPWSVVSPKASVQDVVVIRSTGEHGWALARLLWEGESRLGLRWNGHAANPIGNPQSRGIPTWFVVPPDLAPVLEKHFVGEKYDFSSFPVDVQRVRLRPLPKRVWSGQEQEKVDDVWLVSNVDQKKGSVSVRNIRTDHFLVFYEAHIKTLIEDPQSNTKNQLRNGILELSVQVVFEDGDARLEPLNK